MTKKSIDREFSKKHMARIERERIQRRYLLTGAIVVAVLVVGVIAFGLIDQFILQPGKPVAKVENQTISISDFQKQVRYNRWQLIQQYRNVYQIYQMFASSPDFAASFENNLIQIQTQLDPSYASSLGSSVLEQMINGVIIEQEANRRGITVSEQEIDEELQRLFEYFPAGTPTPEITPTAAFTSTFSPTQLALVTLTPTPDLTPTSTPTETPPPDPDATPTPTLEPLPTETPYTLEAYQDNLENYLKQMAEIGITSQDFRKIIKTQMLSERVYQAFTSDLQPEEEQVWARHILVETEEQAQGVLARLQAGEDWSELAVELSIDESNKDSGGDLGWFGRGKMVSDFETAAFDLSPVGEIGQPVETRFGWHIIQVLGHEVRPLNASEFDSLKQQKFSEWLQDEASSEKVTRYDLWQANIPTEPVLPASLIP